MATLDGFVKERMDELVDLWKGLDLSDEKNEVVQVGYESNLLSADSVELCAVAKVLLTRRISADAFRLVMKSLWRVLHGTQIDPTSDNIFIVHLQS